MNTIKAALFDLDGVIIDTESQYTIFWSGVGERYLPEVENFSLIIKGNTLKQIYDRYFNDKPDVQATLKVELAAFEAAMIYEFIPGALDFVQDLRRNGIRTALVTSSNAPKMKSLKEKLPHLLINFDSVVTAERVSCSKPDPEGYLLAASELGVSPDESLVFEDSISGLAAGRAAGMKVIGLTTTLSPCQIEDKADIMIPDFDGMSTRKLLTLL